MFCGENDFLWLKECWLQMTVTGPGRGLHFRQLPVSAVPQNADVRSTAGHCINVTLSYTFVSGPHGPAAVNSSTAYSNFHC
nr:hypothetical protein [Escherichia coli O25b:H4-ST131]